MLCEKKYIYIYNINMNIYIIYIDLHIYDGEHVEIDVHLEYMLKLMYNCIVSHELFHRLETVPAETFLGRKFRCRQFCAYSRKSYSERFLQSMFAISTVAWAAL